MHIAQLAVVPIALAMLAAAPSSRAGDAPRAGTVTACSTYGRQGCYTAPVRRGRFGPEMRLNGGTWIDCSGDCRDTLRRATVDFWDTQRESSK